MQNYVTFSSSPQTVFLSNEKQPSLSSNASNNQGTVVVKMRDHLKLKHEMYAKIAAVKYTSS